MSNRLREIEYVVSIAVRTQARMRANNGDTCLAVARARLGIVSLCIAVRRRTG